MRLRSYDYRVLDRAVIEIMDTAQRTGARVRVIPLPQKIHKFTILRSPHIDKKARDQFERRTYNRLLEVDCTSQTLEALMGLTVASEVEVEIMV
ncbi:MAG: 30S ribosomal protein S10 [Alphaproteobacteria bacterium]|nr:30S ribosomal protein S10 [Alphaproteobacteria bacterium]